jgi:hypothetical protein
MRAHGTGRGGWSASMGALARGLAVAALLCALIVMHAGLAPAMAGHAAMATASGAMPAVTMPDHAWVDEMASTAGAATWPAGGNLAPGPAVSVMASSVAPGTAGAGGMPGHVGGVMCLAVLTMVALSLVVPLLRRFVRRLAGPPGGVVAPGMRAGRAADRPPEPSAALARLCVLRT